MQMLANAVRVDGSVIPHLSNSTRELQERVGLEQPLEAYVFQEASMNAFVTRGRSHILVALSSGAVNHLAADELEFVIGHELGHTLFGHIDVMVAALLESSSASPRSKMQALAWKRSAEISADRVGLICCRSLETASTALFKTLSGLATRDLRVDPDAFSNQWEHLKQEVLDSGGSDH